MSKKSILIHKDEKEMLDVMVSNNVNDRKKPDRKGEFVEMLIRKEFKRISKLNNLGEE